MILRHAARVATRVTTETAATLSAIRAAGEAVSGDARARLRSIGAVVAYWDSLEMLLRYFLTPAVQLRTTVDGADALGPTGVASRNCFPSAVTSPTIVPGGV